MRMFRSIALTLLALLPAMTTHAEAPGMFGDDHDDPRTAYPSVPRPSTPACTIELVDHGFRDFEPVRGRIDAASQCPGPWHRIVLELDGSVKGRQYDRIGHLAIGGVTVLRTSTPEPSREGIEWRVEKDVTAYAPLLASAQPTEMFLGNVINDTHTGVFEVKLRLQFYRADDAHAAADTADLVAPLDGLRQDGIDTVGTITVPANAERLLAEVHATGSGGGCEEFWYYSVPPETVTEKYWCRAAQGPYREVQVLVDGRVAGIAAPYPHIYTGGWSNPNLWYLIPAPRAFDIAPLRFDLTPFIGAINDGQPHELRLRVAGMPAAVEGGVGWALHPNVQVWRDARSERTHGELLELAPGELALSNRLEAGDGQRHRLLSKASRDFRARGRLKTSHGWVETTVEQRLSADIDHRWDVRDEHDGMRADWTDTRTVTRRVGDAEPLIETHALHFGLEGAIETEFGDDAKPRRLTTTLAIHDDADLRHRRGGDDLGWRETRDRFSGSASYRTGVPRDQRQATGHSTQTYESRDSDGDCYRRTIATRSGRFVRDQAGCADDQDVTE